jgi:hypothetical protein
MVKFTRWISDPTRPRNYKAGLKQASVLSGCIFLVWAATPVAFSPSSGQYANSVQMASIIAPADASVPKANLFPINDSDVAGVDLIGSSDSVLEAVDIVNGSSPYNHGISAMLGANYSLSSPDQSLHKESADIVKAVFNPIPRVSRLADHQGVVAFVDHSTPEPTILTASIAPSDFIPTGLTSYGQTVPAVFVQSPAALLDGAPDPQQSDQSNSVTVNQSSDPNHPGMVTAACIEQASKIQQVPVPIILGFLKTEGGWVGASVGNTNGSHDLGPMQVNDSTWVPQMAKLEFDGDENLARLALRWDGCYNVQVGTWIFRQYWNQANGNTVRAIGYYNSHDPIAMANYQARYAHSLKSLFGAQTATR